VAFREVDSGLLIVDWLEVDLFDAFASATFSAAGEYVLSLTATDTQYTNTDTLTITVLPGTNFPPVVNAGPDQIACLTTPAILVTDKTNKTNCRRNMWLKRMWIRTESAQFKALEPLLEPFFLR
jgi:hypothetical protein